MSKKIEIKNNKLTDEFLSIFAIGLTHCLENNVIDTKRAEEWLFSPSIAYSLRNNFFDKDFIEAIEYSSELDACRNSDYFLKSVKNARNKFVKVIEKSVGVNKSDKNEYSLYLDILAENIDE